MDRQTALAVARALTTNVDGQFQRHVSPRFRALTGSASGGRWGAEGAYPVLYLGRPTDSVIVEAYRHLVDSVEGMRAELVGPRRLLTCQVNMTEVLDLRDPGNQSLVGLSLAEMTGPVGDYEPCQRVAQAAHQLGLHGIIAPAGSGMGETLAIFERRLPADQHPILIDEVVWDRLPGDPREARSLERWTT